MVEAAPTYDFLAELFASCGLMPRGGFHPSPEDGLPGDPQTLILVGNAGPDMWNAFSQLPFNLPNVLDHWSKCAIDADATATGGIALYPFRGPPFLPFQRWVAKAEPVAPSPLGILCIPSMAFGTLIGALWPISRQLSCHPGTNALSRAIYVRTSPVDAF